MTKWKRETISHQAGDFLIRYCAVALCQEDGSLNRSTRPVWHHDPPLNSPPIPGNLRVCFPRRATRLGAAHREFGVSASRQVHSTNAMVVAQAFQKAMALPKSNRAAGSRTSRLQWDRVPCWHQPHTPSKSSRTYHGDWGQTTAAWPLGSTNWLHIDTGQLGAP